MTIDWRKTILTRRSRWRILKIQKLTQKLRPRKKKLTKKLVMRLRGRRRGGLEGGVLLLICQSRIQFDLGEEAVHQFQDLKRGGNFFHRILLLRPSFA